MAAACTLLEVPDDIGAHYLPYKTSLRQRQKARKFANEGYVNRVNFYLRSQSEIEIKSVVFRSQHKTHAGFASTMTINTSQKQVTEAYCHCKAAVSGECSHILAVLMKLSDWILGGLKEVPAQASCTSVPQQWDKPRGPKLIAEPVSTMAISKPGNANRKKKPIIACFHDNREVQLKDTDVEFLQGLEDCPISYMATITDQTAGEQTVGSTLAHQVPLINLVAIEPVSTPCSDLELPKTPPFNLEQHPCVLHNMDKCQHLKLTRMEAVSLEINTRAQSECKLWHIERSKRLTASKFGKVMLRKNPETESFVNSILRPKEFKSSATTYGTANERIAINMYIRKTRFHVHECGFVVNPAFPFLGATPDGKVCDGNEMVFLK